MRITIDVIGRIWQPGIGPCAYTYQPDTAENGRTLAGSIDRADLTREGIEHWLGIHAGDFQEILDFEASWAEPIEPCPTCKRIRYRDHRIPWAEPDSEATFADCHTES